MARPEKNTVEYIPLDCQFTDSIQALEKLYGNDGFVVWVKLLQKLGRTENYIIDVRTSLQWTLFYSIFSIPESRVIEIINTLSELECINPKLWKKKLIYSENFVKRISVVYKKRKYELKKLEDILRAKNISVEETGGFTGKNGVLVEETGVFFDGNSQSKVKESKVKESKVKESNFSSSSSTDFEKFLKNLKKEEEEELRNYSKKNKIKYFRPWLRKLFENGDIEDIKLKAKNYAERIRQKQAENIPPEIEEKSSPEDEQRGLELLRRTAQKIKKGA